MKNESEKKPCQLKVVENMEGSIKINIYVILYRFACLEERVKRQTTSSGQTSHDEHQEPD